MLDDVDMVLNTPLCFAYLINLKSFDRNLCDVSVLPNIYFDFVKTRAKEVAPSSYCNCNTDLM